MAKSKFKEASSEIIEKEFLNEKPEGLPVKQEEVIAVVKNMPKMETVVFRNDRDPGVPLIFHYASATHPLQHYTLYHGKEVTLPIEVIEHLEQCSIPLYAYRAGPDGHPVMYQNGRRHYFTCKTVRAA